MEGNILEKLNDLERTLKNIERRLENLERSLNTNFYEVFLALELVQALEIPVEKAVEAIFKFRRIVSGSKNLDPIERTILEILATGEWLSISEITRLMKRLRGKASRTTIKKKVADLENKGFVEVRKTTNKTLVKLRY